MCYYFRICYTFTLLILYVIRTNAEANRTNIDQISLNSNEKNKLEIYNPSVKIQSKRATKFSRFSTTPEEELHYYADSTTDYPETSTSYQRFHTKSMRKTTYETITKNRKYDTSSSSSRRLNKTRSKALPTKPTVRNLQESTAVHPITQAQTQAPKTPIIINIVNSNNYANAGQFYSNLGTNVN